MDGPVLRSGHADSAMLRRAAWAAAVVVAAGGVAWWLVGGGPQQERWFPGCVFHRLTGWHCAGCGMTRALRELTRGHWLAALRLNPLLVAMLPVVAVGLGLDLLGWVRGPQRRTPALRPAPWMIKALIVLVFAFWVLRNLPWWPFTLLAPQ